jgi:RimJ/RimL family protein N-acetyltransferase
VIVSSFQKSDFEAIKLLKQKYELQQVIQGYLFPHSDEAIRNWFDKISNPGKAPSELHWAVRIDNEFFGYVVLHKIDWINRNAEIGVVIKSPGRGIGNVAVSSVLDIAKNDLGLHKIYAKVLHVNEAGLALFEKLDFVLEGTLREDRFFNGKWIGNMILAKILN